MELCSFHFTVICSITLIFILTLTVIELFFVVFIVCFSCHSFYRFITVLSSRMTLVDLQDCQYAFGAVKYSIRITNIWCLIIGSFDKVCLSPFSKPQSVLQTFSPLIIHSFAIFSPAPSSFFIDLWSFFCGQLISDWLVTHLPTNLF